MFLAMAVLMGVSAREALAVTLIRDAETENTIRAYATPLFEAAGLSPDSIRIFILKDDTLNAFVAGGQNLFINTGLLLHTTNANQLIGVIAHETGHIRDGHIARFTNRMKTGSNVALVSTVLGILTALATGSGDAGAAIAQGGAGLAMNSVLGFSRAQESAADTVALELLDRTHQSARGLAEFMRKIEDQELLPPERQDPYVRTHPLTRDRIEQIEHHLKTSPWTDAKEPAKFKKMHDRMVAKLYAFLSPPQATLDRYKADDHSIPARYARAVAYLHLPDFDKALKLIDGLIAEEPENPYFRELKGQILFEGGRIHDSLAPNREAVRLAPDEALLRVGLARSEIESGDESLLKDATSNLLMATRQEPEYSFAWSQLAIAYGRSGKIGLATVAQAEAALARGDKRQALDYARRAEQRLEKGSAAWLRVQDIKRTAKLQEAREGG